MKLGDAGELVVAKIETCRKQQKADHRQDEDQEPSVAIHDDGNESITKPTETKWPKKSEAKLVEGKRTGHLNEDGRDRHQPPASHPSPGSEPLAGDCELKRGIPPMAPDPCKTSANRTGRPGGIPTQSGAYPASTSGHSAWKRLFRFPETP